MSSTRTAPAAKITASQELRRINDGLEYLAKRGLTQIPHDLHNVTKTVAEMEVELIALRMLSAAQAAELEAMKGGV